MSSDGHGCLIGWRRNRFELVREQHLFFEDELTRGLLPNDDVAVRHELAQRNVAQIVVCHPVGVACSLHSTMLVM